MTLEASVDKSHIRILVVDDHALTRDMVSSILKGLGFSKLDQAENGYVALQKIEDGDFNLIICDWNMPSMSGLQVLEEVRAEQQSQHIPFLMLTAEVYRENVVEAIRAGVSDYIAKPFTADVLGAKVEEVLKKNNY